jgi:uncharacterized protein
MDVPPVPGAAGPSADQRNWAMIAHLSALVMFVGVPSFVGPLVVWLIKREEHPFIAEHGREALNFNISVLIYGVIAGVLVLVLIGILLLIALGIVWLVLTIQAGLAASRGEAYRYPLTIRFVS